MTLTQTATITKRSVVILTALIVVLISAKVGYEIYYQNQLAHLQKIPDKPEEKFGVLPPLSYSGNTVSSSNYTYSVDTQTGELPDLDKVAKIYFIPQAGISLLAPDRAKDLAIKLGFNLGPQILSTTSYQFNDQNGGSMLIDLPTGNLTYKHKYASDSATFAPGFSESPDQMLEEFKNFLINKGLITEDMRKTRGKVFFDNNDPNKAKTAALTLWPLDFNGWQVLTASQSALIRATANTNPDTETRYIEMHFTYWPIDSTTYSTYPLKTASQALEDLKAGKGFIVIEPLKPVVSVTNVYLAYYESEDYTPYLQPVFVFEGPHFQAMVPAVESPTQ